MDHAENNILAQARMHHAYLLGLQLMVASNKEPKLVGEWMHKLFRRQHLEKFLSSFEKLGLQDLPHAVACAQYHVLSNSIGGVPVEYMAESDKKAWVRFRYPRWMYQGATICGVPLEVSRGFLSGWYAHNGISLNNSRLGFVCVSEDMTGEFGLCGYFKEYDFDLNDEQRLQFAKGEIPPVYKEEEQPQLVSNQWSELRLAKANRNYAMDYIRNGIVELATVMGEDETKALAGKAARLIGLQYMAETRELIKEEDGDLQSAANYLSKMFAGLGDRSDIHVNVEKTEIEIVQYDRRIVRGFEGAEEEKALILFCWNQLWQGALSSYRQIKTTSCTVESDRTIWRVSNLS